MRSSDEQTKRLFHGLPKGRFDGETALLCIDLQRLDADTGKGLFEKARKSGVEAGLSEYRHQLLVALPKVARLQDAFRRAGMEVLHIRIQAITQDGRDRSKIHKAMGIHAAPGSVEAEFVPEAAPKGDEIVLNKTSASPFTSTAIDYVLQNLNIRHLVVVGVMTSGCVESTVRDAADRGYVVSLVSDACAGRTAEMQEKTLSALGGLYAHLMTTKEVLGGLESAQQTGDADQVPTR